MGKGGKGDGNANKRSRTSPLSSSSSSSASPQQPANEESGAESLEAWKTRLLEAMDKKYNEFKTLVMQYLRGIRTKVEDMTTHINNKGKEERKSTFVIHGIPEVKGETTRETETKVIEMLKNKMKIPEDEAKDMISSTFRMGKANQQQNQKPKSNAPITKSRPILLKLLREKHRSTLTSHLSKLRNTDIKVESYLLDDERKVKNILMKFRKEEKARGRKVKMLDDQTLMVNDKYYGVKDNEICIVEPTKQDTWKRMLTML